MASSLRTVEDSQVEDAEMTIVPTSGDILEGHVEALASLVGQKTGNLELLVESCVDEVSEKVDSTKMAVEKVLETKKIEGETAEAMKHGIEYVGSKNVSIEERMMYGDLDLHECVRMLTTCGFEYSDSVSDLEWMSQICLRELCKLEKRTREEVVLTHLEIKML